jgi:hypothetical protein
MKKNTILLLLVLVTAIIAPLQSSSATEAFNGPSSSGHGNITLGELRTFSYHAITLRDGTVRGNMTLHNRDSGNFIQADINCLRVVGNNASMSGVVTKSSDPAFVGFQGFFRVQDNGEGANSPADLMSLFNLGTVVPDCNTAFAPPLLAIEGGNVQVKP